MSAQGSSVSVTVTPYQNGELHFAAPGIPDTVSFSNGIALYQPVLAALPPGTSNLENCSGGTPLSLVARSSGTYRCGVRRTCVGGELNFCYYPSFGTYHEPWDPDPYGRDSALLVYVIPGGQDQYDYRPVYGDTIWDQALQVPDSLYDSSAYAASRSTLFGVPVYILEYHCVGTFLWCDKAKVPSRGLVVYATGPGASLKFQISDVQIDAWTHTTNYGVCTEDTLSSITIRWAADSAGNRRFLPSSNAAQRGIPVSPPREQPTRIERPSGSMLVHFSAPVESATLFDARGVAVARASGEITTLAVPASRVKGGLYFLRVNRHGEVETIRVPVR
jgi:hypothetical protein